MARSPLSQVLAPSILAADHADLLRGLQEVKNAGCSWVHLDIMDGHFVPNLSFGPQTVKDLAKEKENLFFDTHLMLDNPDKYIDPFVDAGSDQITIHVEPKYDLKGTINKMKDHGVKVGLALNPGSNADLVKPWLEEIDLVLIMTVWPGFGGQSFITDTLTKMAQIHQWRTEANLHFRLEVDGGINLETAEQCKPNGVDTFVAGTAFYKSSNLSEFRKSIEQ